MVVLPYMKHLASMLCYGERFPSFEGLPKTNPFRFSWKRTPKELLRAIHQDRPAAVTMSFRRAAPYLDLASAILHQTQGHVPLFLVVEDDVTEAQGFAQLVANPHVDFASSKSRPMELAQRLRVLLRAHEIPTRERLPGQNDVTKNLYDTESHRLNAKKVADVFGLNLRQLSALLEMLPATVHKTPDSERLQGKLRVFERMAKGLSLVENNEDSFRRWLNAPNPELEQKTPLEIIREGRGEVVANLVEDALLGQPS
jgi:hypothetical protein